MKPRLAIIGLILGFVAAARADDEPPPAPLENTKQELQTLARDQAANKAGTQEGSMKDALPRMQSPVPSGPALEMPQSSNSPSELKKKKDAQKNWLLDGVNQLEREAKLKDNPQSDRDKLSDHDQQTEEAKLDPADTDYFLKVYSEEQKKAEAEKSNHKDGKHKDELAQNDPFAPFLQGWLAGSPVRGKFFDEFMKRPGTQSGDLPTSGPAVAPGDNPAGVSLATSESAAGPVPVATSGAATLPNPYLQAFNLSEAATAPSGPPSASIFAPTAKSLVPVAADNLPPARPTDRKPPPSPFADNKFFPQGKHF